MSYSLFLFSMTQNVMVNVKEAIHSLSLKGVVR